MLYIQDRVYSFLIGGLHKNSDPGKRYFFDKEDNYFFLLDWDNNELVIHKNFPQFLSETIKDKLLNKIKKVNNGSSSIIEIYKLNDAIEIDYSRPRDSEKFKQIFQLEQAQFNKAKEFIEKHNIDIEKADIIE